MDWCRDVDYGNLPQWVAIVLGSIVAGFSIWGVRTANESYKISREAFKLDVRNREFAQARLIYAELSASYWLEPLDVKRINLAEKRGFEVVDLIENHAPSESIQTLSRSYGVQVSSGGGQYLRVLVVSVVNNSEELISGVEISVNKSNGAPILQVGPHNFENIAPKTASHRLILTDNRDRDIDYIQVTFRDSTGQWWTREGAHPVRKVPSPS